MYADVLVFLNIVINYFILGMTSKFSKFKTTRIKLFIGSSLGALYVLIVFFPSMQFLYTLPMKIAVSVLMIIVAFKPERLIDFLKILGIFYVVAFALGGAGFCLCYLAGMGSAVGNGFYTKNSTVQLLIAAVALAYILLSFCWSYIQEKVLHEELIYTVTISVNGRQVVVNAILDTGNTLREPISNFHVIVVEYEVLREILPDKIMELFNEANDGINLEEFHGHTDEGEYLRRIRLIPFSSLGRQNGMLIGIRPDAVKIASKKGSKEVNDVVIGIANMKVSKDGEYKGLLYPDILK